ncbi:MAG TPA: alpha/beta hydrolase [Paraburkholderia sp.]|uniref:alpha/beta hydrolase n=1 Tax=Paraburkholderia sp. TaxID=1926495 RepID=UPI002B48FD83|nr:alpha/beta hydrolase [Paraburkholderia sp.]HKR45661.1 alpha/beta hydrolase [Paraburkholderia sp.]
MKRWIIRIALAALALIILVTASGSTYEAYERHLNRKRFPPPGELVDIGDRKIQLYCIGTGSPTVVFESGLDISGALSWSAVMPSVSAKTRACSYSRAGIMWSDSSNGSPNAKAVAEDLHLALNTANEHGPFVLVGQSLGGPYIMTYTKYYGADVAGLVFVDASHPDQVKELQKVMPPSDTKLAEIGAALSWSGLVRALAPGLIPQAPNQSLDDIQAIRAYAPTSLGPMLRENNALNETLAEAGTFRQLGRRPLYVLTAMAPFSAAALQSMKITSAQGEQVRAIWKRLQDDEASWSSNSRHEYVDSDHDIQFERPDVVIHAVDSVIDSVRTSRHD